MILSEAERVQALAHLHAAGIIGSDAITALATFEDRTQADTIATWKADVTAQLDGLTLVEKNRRLSAQFGSDAVRLASVLLQRDIR